MIIFLNWFFIDVYDCPTSISEYFLVAVWATYLLLSVEYFPTSACVLFKAWLFANNWLWLFPKQLTPAIYQPCTLAISQLLSVAISRQLILGISHQLDMAISKQLTMAISPPLSVAFSQTTVCGYSCHLSSVPAHPLCAVIEFFLQCSTVQGSTAVQCCTVDLRAAQFHEAQSTAGPVPVTAQARTVRGSDGGLPGTWLQGPFVTYVGPPGWLKVESGWKGINFCKLG